MGCEKNEERISWKKLETKFFEQISKPNSKINRWNRQSWQRSTADGSNSRQHCRVQGLDRTRKGRV